MLWCERSSVLHFCHPLRLSSLIVYGNLIQFPLPRHRNLFSKKVDFSCPLRVQESIIISLWFIWKNKYIVVACRPRERGGDLLNCCAPSPKKKLRAEKEGILLFSPSTLCRRIIRLLSQSLSALAWIEWVNNEENVRAVHNNNNLYVIIMWRVENDPVIRSIIIISHYTHFTHSTSSRLVSGERLCVTIFLALSLQVSSARNPQICCDISVSKQKKDDDEASSARRSDFRSWLTLFYLKNTHNIQRSSHACEIFPSLLVLCLTHFSTAAARLCFQACNEKRLC